MNNSKKYNWGDLVVTVDYAKGFDYTDKNIVKASDVTSDKYHGEIDKGVRGNNIYKYGIGNIGENKVKAISRLMNKE